MYRLSQRSWQRLKGVDPRLVAVVAGALRHATNDFTVLECLRTQERQRELVAAGKSQTQRSRHLTGHAVDLGVLVDGQVSWQFDLYRDLAAAMQRSADELGVGIVWGGTWTSLRDGPHFQLEEPKP
jgi:peptidoglycan L-alanyl-D-glutamate endopeptidase CwlK